MNNQKKIKDLQIKKFSCLLISSMIQAISDNPFTSYRQLLQQYTQNKQGQYYDINKTKNIVRNIFLNNPINVSFSGLKTRLIGNFIKRVPKFGLILGYNGNDKTIRLDSILFAAIFASPFVNPIRFIEKQQRLNFHKSNIEINSNVILDKCKKYYYFPLFRGITPLITHTFISTSLGIFYQNKIQKKIYNYNYFQNKNINRFYSNLTSSIIISPIYIFLTNPIERIETIIQIKDINKPKYSIINAIKEYKNDVKINGYKGFFRGNGTGILKAIISLTVFHETRMTLEKIIIK